MIYEKIKLFENNEEAFLETYCADKVWDKKRDAILVIPGGGYGNVCSDREGEPIALEYVSRGINAFVLHYSIGEKALFPQPLIEASAAMKYIKENCEKYNINADRVFACGFSAGGHLCAALGIMWDMKEIYNTINMEYGYNKPKGIMPIYPVISATVKGTHKSSFYNILGTKAPSHEQELLYSLETKVSKNSSPAFIAHTSNDNLVSVRNSLALANAYADNDMKFELHVYYDGPHGIALANDITSMGESSLDNTSAAQWLEESVKWMKLID